MPSDTDRGKHSTDTDIIFTREVGPNTRMEPTPTHTFGGEFLGVVVVMVGWCSLSAAHAPAFPGDRVAWNRGADFNGVRR